MRSVWAAFAGAGLRLVPAYTTSRRHTLFVGGIVLCGGKSRRMGQPKEWLSIRGEPMLRRVVRRLGEVVSLIVVVAAADQELPPLPAHVLVAHDVYPDRGPLEGLRAGLCAMTALASPTPEAVFVVSCDAPLLTSAFVQRVIESLDADDEAAVPDVDDRLHPLASIYRVSVLATIDRLLAADQRRMQDLCAAIRTRRIPIAALREVDPDLASLVNVNRPEEFEFALRALENGR